MEEPDYYVILGVESTASVEQIRASYRTRAFQLHPDRIVDPEERNRAEIQMATVNEAWRILSDPSLRAAYDRNRVVDALPVVGRTEPPSWRPASSPTSGIEVSPAVGCALRFGPVLLAIGVLVALLVVTALATGDSGSSTRLVPGQCVEVDDEIHVRPCAIGIPKIVARGVAGTSCPSGSVPVVLATRTTQICIAPIG